MKATIIYINWDKPFSEPTTFDFPIDDFVPAPVFDLEERLDIIFEQCNHIDGKEWITNKNLRSLSVGDLVKLDNNLYVCAKVGWQKIG